jgi:transposase
VPRACKPYRARTKGKVDSGVKYVQRNALAGHQFDDWNGLDAHLNWWMDEIADMRVQGTTPMRQDSCRLESKQVNRMVRWA